MTIAKKIKINTKIINTGNLERRAFRILLGAFIGSLAIYMIFLGKTVFSIVERKNIENEIRTESARIGELEIDYLARSNKVDMNLAGTLGFSESKKVHFAARRGFAYKTKANGHEL